MHRVHEWFLFTFSLYHQFNMNWKLIKKHMENKMWHMFIFIGYWASNFTTRSTRLEKSNSKHGKWNWNITIHITNTWPITPTITKIFIYSFVCKFFTHWRQRWPFIITSSWISSRNSTFNMSTNYQTNEVEKNPFLIYFCIRY